MRIVLDTNVLIAAFIARGVCHDLLEHCVRAHELILSDFILNKFHEKLTEKFKYPVEEAGDAIELLRSRIEIVEPTAITPGVCRDPDDDNVLGTAVAGSCALIITGDKDLLVLEKFRGISIVAPAGFQDYEAGRRDAT